MEEFTKIKKLITDNDIVGACTALKNYNLDERTLNEILLQEAKYYKLKRDARNDIISDDYESRTMSKIVYSFLQIVDNIKKDSVGTEKEKANEVHANNKTSEKEGSKKDRKEVLYEEAGTYYKMAINQIGYNKRSVHINSSNAAIVYKIITSDYPKDAYGYLCLAQSLKVIYLLNYNNNRTKENLDEIEMYIVKGKSVDMSNGYNNSFDLILLDIKNYIKNKKIFKMLLIASASFLVIEAIYILAIRDYELLFNNLGEQILLFLIFAPLALCSYLDEHIKKHLSGN